MNKITCYKILNRIQSQIRIILIFYSGLKTVSKKYKNLRAPVP